MKKQRRDLELFDLTAAGMKQRIKRIERIETGEEIEPRIEGEMEATDREGVRIVDIARWLEGIEFAHFGEMRPPSRGRFVGRKIRAVFPFERRSTTNRIAGEMEDNGNRSRQAGVVCAKLE